MSVKIIYMLRKGQFNFWQNVQGIAGETLLVTNCLLGSYYFVVRWVVRLTPR
jgi:hypothetical protein